MVEHILQDSDEDMKLAFRAFDQRSKGVIKAKQIRDIMEQIDESLTVEEMNDILSFSHYNDETIIAFPGKLKKWFFLFSNLSGIVYIGILFI